MKLGTHASLVLKSGLQRGVADERGQVFLDGMEVIVRRQSRSFMPQQVGDLAEDVRFRPIFEKCLAVLREEGYPVQYRMMCSHLQRLPQNRRRVYILGVRTDQPMLLA